MAKETTNSPLTLILLQSTSLHLLIHCAQSGNVIVCATGKTPVSFLYYNLAFLLGHARTTDAQPILPAQTEDSLKMADLHRTRTTLSFLFSSV